MKARTKAVLRPTVAAALNRFTPGSLPDIALVSSPRSGSTWVMELISSSDAVTYRDEPDHRLMIDAHEFLDINTRWAYASLSPGERQALADYLSDDRRVRLFGPTAPWNVGWHYSARRRVLKCIRMTAVIDFFVEDLKYDTVYLVRHPIAQALSSLTRGHLSRLDCYLGDAAFMSALPSELRSRALRIAAAADPLEAGVLEWCLANRTALLRAAPAPWFACTYEHALGEPAEVFPRLWDFLRLADWEAALRRVAVPSKNSDPQHRRAITGDAAARSGLAGSWRARISAQEERRLMTLVADFGIDLYVAGEDLPVRKLHEQPQVAIRGSVPVQAVKGAAEATG